MPLMRIRSVEIVFQDDLSTCTDTGLLDRSIELLVSDSDDSTKCVDDLEHLHVAKDENDDSVTLNADGDLSDDDSITVTKDNILSAGKVVKVENNVPMDSLTVTDDTLSLNISELGDSGRFTEDACSSRVEIAVPCEDALLSHSFDAVNVEETSACNVDETDDCDDIQRKLFEYIDSHSESSDDTAICEDTTSTKFLTPSPNVPTNEEQTLYDSYELQYDSYIDMGKF
ncbi:unnamed protein product [Colias eurytheme]|nr:unnamed protein product [Colias eurytheme]